MILQMSTSLHSKLQSSGHSQTPARRDIFSYLRTSGPVTVALVIEAHPAFNRASVYRTLALFRQLGIVHDLIAGGQKLIELTDEFDTHHHHLTCVSCGTSITITDAPIENRLNAIAKARGFAPTAHQIEISGLCAKCQQASKL